jgi:hypothetical protein
LANGTSRTLMNPPFVNGRYINQWETPINEWLVLAYGRDQIDSASHKTNNRNTTKGLELWTSGAPADAQISLGIGIYIPIYLYLDILAT